MGTINTLNGVECGIINAVNNLLAGAGGDILKWDDNTFCPVPTATPTPTPTPTPSPTPGGSTPTPTPTQCPRGCCLVELCYSDGSCPEACSCLVVVPVYLGINCETDPCILANAYGIFDDERCGTYAAARFYSDGTDCYYWDGSGNLNFNVPCE